MEKNALFREVLWRTSKDADSWMFEEDLGGHLHRTRDTRLEGVYVTRVHSLTPGHSKLRLRHVLMHFRGMYDTRHLCVDAPHTRKGWYLVDKVFHVWDKPIHIKHWRDVWQEFHDTTVDNLKSVFSGPLKHGLLCRGINSVHAVVIDTSNQLWRIVGGT